MLSINWDDVLALIESIRPQLIAVGVILLLAILVTIAARKMSTSPRKLTRSTTWVAAIAAIAIAVTTMLYGGLKTVLDLASGSGVLTEDTKGSVEELANAVSEEGMVLLKNTGHTLPLAQNSTLNVFGWASTNPVYGGTGSGSLNDDNPTTSLLDGLHNAGFETNEDLTNFYTDYRSDRPDVGMFSADWTLPEPSASSYSDALISQVDSYSDTAIVTIGRSGGEGFDLPTDVNAEVASNASFSYTDNSTSQKDFEDGQGYLELTAPEKQMIELAKAHSDTLVVVYNGANAFELGQLTDDPDVDAIIWAIPPGQVGFNALGRILNGEVTPSAKTPDTFVRDLKRSPAANNFGDMVYANMEEFKQKDLFSDNMTSPSFVNYVEGIYVGYRWYETAAAEGVINYDEEVVYPFGYGLSYTSFTQTMGDITRADGVITFDVTVTNTGDVAGKDVVEVYDNPPYTNGGIEKAAVNLVAYEKTELLDPGASQTLSISINEDELASYDAVNAKAYVLEAGDYRLSIRSDSHTIIDEKTVSIEETITYNTPDNTHNGDNIVATNVFDAAKGDVTYLSRADRFANYEQASAAPSSFDMPEKYKATFIATSNYDPKALNNEADQMPTTGADNDLVLADVHGLDYSDPQWDKLLDQLSVDDMDKLIANGGYGSVAVSSVGKIRVSDVDGPAALNNNFTGVGSIGLPVSVSVAATWNKDLAHDFGTAIGSMAHDMNVAGWYAPATNTHRYAYSGRNFEYFSEDGLLAGRQVAQEIQGAQELGVYAFLKHFALNDQETHRTHMLATWSNEQALREIYLKPFEIGVKEGGAHAIMTAFNYIGTVYAGAMPELQITVLRDEWGFRGMTLTDYFGGYGYQNADQLIRNGGDMMLATLDLKVSHVQDRSATSVIAMRNASHDILYTVANSWIYEDGQPELARLTWEYITWVVLALISIGLIALEVVAIRRYRGRKAGLPAVATGRALSSDEVSGTPSGLSSDVSSTGDEE